MLGYRRVNSTHAAAAAALLAFAAYGATMAQRAYVHDDAWIVGGNALLDAGAAGARTLATTGYWEGASGRSAPVHEYRPLLMLTFLAQRAVTGRSPAPQHAVNVLLHVLACWLVLAALKRKISFEAAVAGALAFAVMPTHVEAVAALTGRSELLTADLLLGAWLLLEGPAAGRRLAGGAALFCAALLVKEHALLFPAFLALSDWAFDGERPWSPGRRRVYAVLLTSIAAYLLLRLAALGIPFGGGAPYFADRLTAALTVSRFAFTRYLWPSLTGLGLCPDFAKPLIADAHANAPGSWPAALLLAGLYAAAVRALLARRAPWAFWLCAFSLFLLPTAHVLVPLDTLGAQRFLYLPSVGLAAGIGLLWARAHAARPRAALALGCALLGWQAWACASYAASWRSGVAYYETVLACNPVSARARAAYGMELILNDRAAEGEASLAESIRLDPSQALPYYDLALLAWQRHDVAETERLIAASLARDPGTADAWVISALVSEARGRAAETEASLRRALALAPWNPQANFNLARLELATGRQVESIPHWRAFARFAPRDPEAGAAEDLARGLAARAASAR